MAVPLFYEMIAKNRADAAVNQLLSILNFSRNSSFINNTTIIWCPSQDHQHCSKNWSGEQIIFRDQEGNYEITEPHQLLRVIPALTDGSQLSWQGFQSKNYIKISPENFSMTMDGRFIYFPANRDPRYRRELIINRMGRGRIVESSP